MPKIIAILSQKGGKKIHQILKVNPETWNSMNIEEKIEISMIVWKMKEMHLLFL